MYLNVIACHHQISQNFAWVEQSLPRTVGFSAKSSELHRGPIWYVPRPFRKSIASVESEWRTPPSRCLFFCVVDCCFNVLWFVVAHGSTNIMDPTWSMLTCSDFWGSEAISSDHFFGSDIEEEELSTDERKQRSKISKLGIPDQIFISDQISDGFSNVSSYYYNVS